MLGDVSAQAAAAAHHRTSWRADAQRRLQQLQRPLNAVTPSVDRTDQAQPDRQRSRTWQRPPLLQLTNLSNKTTHTLSVATTSPRSGDLLGANEVIYVAISKLVASQHGCCQWRLVRLSVQQTTSTFQTLLQSQGRD